MATAAPPGGGDSHILREYLVALGFRVDEHRRRRFDNTLTQLDKRASQVGRSVLGIAAAAGVMAVAFTRSMERLYYNARYADTTVGRLQALEAAGRRVGLAGGEMTQGVKSMAAALRANPGLSAMLEGLGVPVKGRQMDDVMIDFVKATKSMPFSVAQQYAEMFNISPEMLFNMQAGLDIMIKARQERERMAADMGVNPDELAETSVELSNIWRDVVDQAGMFGLAIAKELMPEIRALSLKTREILQNWREVVVFIKQVQKSYEGDDFWLRLNEGMTGRTFGGGVELSPGSKQRLGTPRPPTMNPIEIWRRWREDRTNTKRKNVPGADINAVEAAQDVSDLKAGSSPQDYLRMLEQRYGLPEGILDRTWQRESSRGVNMLSPKGARGHFGFMPKTQKEYGLKDPDDFKESADASARKWRDLMREFGGDTRLAAIAYNWGQGNMAKFGLGKTPKEASDYADFISGPEVNVNTEVNVYGVSEPERAADSVVRKVGNIAGEVTRNMSPRIK